MTRSVTRLAAVGGLMLGAVAPTACGTPPPSRPDLFTPVATVGQVMDAIVIPSSQAVFDAVVYVNGEPTRAPRSDDDWHALQMHALAVAEAGNLLLIAPRVKAEPAWTDAAAAMTRAAASAARAAEGKNVERVLTAGTALYATCTACHRAYLQDLP